jgi:hypothetical protein
MNFSMKTLSLLMLGLSLSAGAKPSGATKELGWVIRKTKNGIVKIPKRQIFEFDPTDIGGEVDKPFQTTFGDRKGPDRKSLIPIRTSYRKEILESVGLE